MSQYVLNYELTSKMCMQQLFPNCAHLQSEGTNSIAVSALGRKSKVKNYHLDYWGT